MEPIEAYTEAETEAKAHAVMYQVLDEVLELDALFPSHSALCYSKPCCILSAFLCFSMASYAVLIRLAATRADIIRRLSRNDTRKQNKHDLQVIIWKKNKI